MKKLYKKYTNLSDKQKIQLIIGLGVFVRLILMPFFAHVDLISTYTRAYKVAFQGHNLLEYGQVLSHFIEVINLKIYGLFFNENNLLPLALSRSANPWTNFNLFWMKLPYLLFDLMALKALWEVVKKDKNKIEKLAFYFLNPILIFAVYMFGRYEVFPIFFLLVAILLNKKKKPLLSALVFGLTILSRTSFLILLPFFVAFTGKTIIKKILAGICALLPYITVLILKSSLLDITKETDWLTTGQHSNYIFGMKFNLMPGLTIYVGIILLSILGYKVLEALLLKRDSYSMQINTLSLVLLIFYATSVFHPQYLAWIVPLLALNLPSQKEHKLKIILPWALIFIALPAFLLSWHDQIIPDIAKPLSNSIANFKLSNFVDGYYDHLKLGNVAKSFISGMMIVLGSSLYTKAFISIKNRKVDTK